MRIAAVLALALVHGCSASKDEAPDGPCGPRSGLYRVSWTRESGDCGAIPDQLVPVATNPGPDPACAGTVGSSKDNCRITLDTTCPIGGTSTSRLRTVGTVTWSADGRTGSGSIQYTEIDAKGDVACLGLYAVTYAKQ